MLTYNADSYQPQTVKHRDSSSLPAHFSDESNTSKSLHLLQRRNTLRIHTSARLYVDFTNSPSPPNRHRAGIQQGSYPLRHLAAFGQLRHMLALCASHHRAAFLRHLKFQHSLLPQISVTVQSTTTHAMPGSQSTICRIDTDTCTACKWLSLYTAKGLTGNV